MDSHDSLCRRPATLHKKLQTITTRMVTDGILSSQHASLYITLNTLQKYFSEEMTRPSSTQPLWYCSDILSVNSLNPSSITFSLTSFKSALLCSHIIWRLGMSPWLICCYVCWYIYFLVCDQRRRGLKVLCWYFWRRRCHHAVARGRVKVQSFVRSRL